MEDFDDICTMSYSMFKSLFIGTRAEDIFLWTAMSTPPPLVFRLVEQFLSCHYNAFCIIVREKNISIQLLFCCLPIHYQRNCKQGNCNIMNKIYLFPSQNY